MARAVAREQVDVRDAAWAPGESTLLALLDCEEDGLVEDLVELAQAVQEILEQEDTLQQISLPVKIYGDIHGQFRDLLLLLLDFGFPSSSGPSFVFNGDWVDRGAHQLEVLVLVFAFKLAFPRNVFLNRGNHEFPELNADMGSVGFKATCAALGPGGMEVFDAFHEAFCYLPLGCVAAGAVFIVHGGIGDGDWDLEDLATVERPLNEDELWQDNLLLNLLWSDPRSDHRGQSFGVHHSHRDKNEGRIVEWSADVTDDFCERNGLAMVVRSHDVEDVEDAIKPGYSAMHGNRLLRVFSARDYEGLRSDAGVLFIEDTFAGLNVQPQILRSMARGSEASKAAPVRPASTASTGGAKRTVRRKRGALGMLCCDGMRDAEDAETEARFDYDDDAEVFLPPPWTMEESTTSPGEFYYHNPDTGETQWEFPTSAGKGWTKTESTTEPGSFYHIHDATGVATWGTSLNELPAGKKELPPKKGPTNGAKTPTNGTKLSTGSSMFGSMMGGSKKGKKSPATGNTSTTTGTGKKPPKWFKEESTTYPGSFYYRNEATGEVTWERPAAGGWEKIESTSSPGEFYLKNDVTGETGWP